MTLLEFKNELEKALLITKWSPTEAQLEKILCKLKEFHGKPTKTSIGVIVLEIVGSYEAISLEGADNSDLTTLLVLATKTGSSK